MHLPAVHHLVELIKLNFSNSPSSPTVEAIELRVHMDCPGCERTVRKALSRLKGIHSVEIDRELQKVTVTGYVDKYKVLNRVRRKGKLAEFWPYPDELEAHLISPAAHSYTDDFLPQLSYGSPYNYRRKRGYSDTYASSYARYNPRPDDPIVEAFSDDNPNNCSIM